MGYTGGNKDVPVKFQYSNTKIQTNYEYKNTIYSLIPAVAAINCRGRRGGRVTLRLNPPLQNVCVRKKRASDKNGGSFGFYEIMGLLGAVFAVFVGAGFLRFSRGVRQFPFADA